MKGSTVFAGMLIAMLLLGCFITVGESGAGLHNRIECYGNNHRYMGSLSEDPVLVLEAFWLKAV